MDKITPCLWFDNNAEEAALFYVSLFKNSKVKTTTNYDEATATVSGQPKDTVMLVPFTLAGQEFIALNGGKVFSFSRATSFFVNCDTEKELDTLWEKFSKSGTILMELGMYPFSEKYGWIEDKFGLSWQLSLNKNQKQKIVPFLMFVNERSGTAEVAIKAYTKLFKKSKILSLEKWGANDPFGKEGTIMHSSFSLNGNEFMASENSQKHEFTFTSAISFVIDCKDQKEVDYFWNAFLNNGTAQQCGWIVDKFGVTWQVVPKQLNTLLASKDSKKAERVMKAMLEMVKLDVAMLKKAANQKE